MSRGTRTFIIYLVLMLGVYIVSNGIGGFSSRQSIALAIVAIAIMELFSFVVGRTSSIAFTPYYLTIRPNWPILLTDFRLISEPEEWHEIQKSFDGKPFTEYHVLRQGIHLTVLNESDDPQRLLIYSDYHRSFVSEVDFEEDMNPLTLPTPEFIERSFGKHVPQFFIKWGVDGYELGLSVPDEWWNSNKELCPKDVRERHEHAIGKVRLTLAVIPYSEFALYWWPTKYNRSFLEKREPAIRNQMADNRTKFNWMVHEETEIPELPIRYPTSIYQKYFVVEHRGI